MPKPQDKVKMDILRLEGQLRAIKKRMGEGDWRKLFILAAGLEGGVDRLIRDMVGDYLAEWGDKLPKGKTEELDEILKIVLKRM